MAANTTILFVPGAWHSPDSFDPVIQKLKGAGYKTSKVYLPSNGHGKRALSFDTDVTEIRKRLEQTLRTGPRVVVVAHSYGSIPACEAIHGLDVRTRQEAGLQGGVAHIFFCCGFVVPEGKSLLSVFGGQEPPWFDVAVDKLEVNVSGAEAAKVFYNDLDEGQVKKAVSELLPHSYRTFLSTCTYEAWRDVPSTYLYCLKDMALPLSVQKSMVEETAKGCGIRTETVDASHSPFISKPEETALAIRRAAGEEI